MLPVCGANISGDSWMIDATGTTHHMYVTLISIERTILMKDSLTNNEIRSSTNARYIQIR